MVKEVVSFRLSKEELMFLDGLAAHYGVSRTTVLSKILELFIKDAIKQERLKEELKTIALKKIEQQTLKEIREQGKMMLSKATWRIRMIKFYTKMIESGVRWDEFKDTFISWIQEAKVLGIDEKTVRETIEEIALIYHRVRQDIDLDKGVEWLIEEFLKEVYGDDNGKEAQVGKAL